MPPLLYYITDRTAFPGDELSRRRQLLAKIREAAEAGIDYIQLREKDLAVRDLESLAREAMTILRDTQPRIANRELRTALLINSRTDIALATGAAGVHFPADDLCPAAVHRISQRSCGADTPVRLTITQACHSPEQVHQAAQGGADLALFAPVFEKKDRPGTPPAGLDELHQACQHPIRVLALGGVTLDNAATCLTAGAAGIAAIRLFQDHDIAEVARGLRLFHRS
jgi:thiamine-phosphate pyrophosphorylase